MSGVSETFWAIAIGLIMLAILFMLVRPGSPAGTAINDVTGALAALVTISTNNFGGTSNG